MVLLTGIDWSVCLVLLVQVVIVSEALLTADKQFPIPTDPACHSFGSQRVCNPDDVLTSSDISLIDESLEGLEQLTLNCRGADYGLQFGVFIERRSRVRTASSVRNTAKLIHNEWGVGYTTPCGGTGILLYLVIDDHQIYFSRGAALHDILSDRALQNAMQVMKPLLRQELYGHAIQLAVQSLSKEMANASNNSASPQGGQSEAVREEWRALLGALFLLFGACWCCFCLSCLCQPQVSNAPGARFGPRGQPQQSAQSFPYLDQKLQELDEIHAQVRDDQCYVATSCPLCMERFPLQRTIPAIATETYLVATEATPLVVRATPIEEGASDEFAATIKVGEIAPTKMGKDGQPLQLLPCGHVFDSVCIGQHMKSQRLKHNTITPSCPICFTSILGNNPQQQQQGCNFLDGSAFDRHKYLQERWFRLDALHRQFPHEIPRHLILEWKHRNYHGSMMADLHRHRQAKQYQQHQRR